MYIHVIQYSTVEYTVCGTRIRSSSVKAGCVVALQIVQYSTVYSTGDFSFKPHEIYKVCIVLA